MRSSIIRITLVTFLFVFFISGQLQGQEKSDGRFIAKGDGTVLDTKTGLMWAAKDNGSNIDWWDARRYCENYRGGGYNDWRLPTLGEIEALHDRRKSQKMECVSDANHAATDLIHLTCFSVWYSWTRESVAGSFSLASGSRSRHNPSQSIAMRALPVRYDKRPAKRDSRFIAKGNGTVLDKKTGLIWADKDNGSDIDWADAKTYCENYRGGGYTDWRMPTLDELAGLYDAKTSQEIECGGYFNHAATDLIDFSCSFVWASERDGNMAPYFCMADGTRNSLWWTLKRWSRALPVRSGK